MSELPEQSLTIVEAVPQGLLDCGADSVHQVLGAPTLMHLEGRDPRPLFVSTLLHGNEHTGLAAVQQLLRRYGGRTLPRALTVFFGNVAAAREGLRRLAGQPDYNRVWPGTDLAPSPETAMARAVLQRVVARAPFAAIDVHNNTGTNPLYGCLTRTDAASLHLAALFSRIAVWFGRPVGTLTGAFATHCPSIAIECGKSGVAAVAERVADYLEACLHLDHFPSHPVAASDLDLYHTIASVRIPPAVAFRFDGTPAALRFEAGLERFNFRELAAGTPFATVAATVPGIPLDVRDLDDRPASERFFARDGQLLRIARPVVPAMITTDERVIRQDVLCYLMERLGRERPAADAQHGSAGLESAAVGRRQA